jgi:hypothetical protein
MAFLQKLGNGTFAGDYAEGGEGEVARVEEDEMAEQFSSTS